MEVKSLWFEYGKYPQEWKKTCHPVINGYRLPKELKRLGDHVVLCTADGVLFCAVDPRAELICKSSGGFALLLPDEKVLKLINAGVMGFKPLENPEKFAVVVDDEQENPDHLGGNQNN